MNAVVQFVVKHGYPILFAAIFARQIGLPLPAPLFLLAARALAAVGKLNFFAAFALAVTGCVLADWAWYEAGRRWGNRVLHFLHRFSPDPDTADRRAKERFARYGPPFLVPAKFVPGLDAVVPPLAGTSRTSRVRFLAFEAVGASLWSGGYAGLGYFFSQDLGRVAAYAATAGRLTQVSRSAHSLCMRYRNCYAGIAIGKNRNCRGPRNLIRWEAPPPSACRSDIVRRHDSVAAGMSR
jgi:membrane protein DedA with SNARE-associated domain